MAQKMFMMCHVQVLCDVSHNFGLNESDGFDLVTDINDYWVKIDQLDVTCFIMSLFTAQNVSAVSTSTFRSLGLVVDLFHVLYCCGSKCVVVTVW